MTVYYNFSLSTLLLMHYSANVEISDKNKEIHEQVQNFVSVP